MANDPRSGTELPFEYGPQFFVNITLKGIASVDHAVVYGRDRATGKPLEQRIEP